MYETIEEIRVRALEIALANSAVNFSQDDLMSAARAYAQYISTGAIPADHVPQDNRRPV